MPIITAQDGNLSPSKPLFIKHQAPECSKEHFLDRMAGNVPPLMNRFSSIMRFPLNFVINLFRLDVDREILYFLGGKFGLKYLKEEGEKIEYLYSDIFALNLWSYPL